MNPKHERKQKQKGARQRLDRVAAGHPHEKAINRLVLVAITEGAEYLPLLEAGIRATKEQTGEAAVPADTGRDVLLRWDWVSGVAEVVSGQASIRLVATTAEEPTIVKTVTVAADQVKLAKSFHLDGTYNHDQGEAVPHGKDAVVLVTGQNAAGFGLGFVPEGFQARQFQGGPLVPGPWAYAYPKAGVIDNFGGTGAELERAKSENRLYEVAVGDYLEINGVRFEVRAAPNRNIKLVKV